MYKLFGMEPIPYSEIANIKNASSDLIVYAVPFMAVFTLIEVWYSWRHDKKSYNNKEAFGSVICWTRERCTQPRHKGWIDLRCCVCVQPRSVANGFKLVDGDSLPVDL